MRIFMLLVASLVIPLGNDLSHAKAVGVYASEAPKQSKQRPVLRGVESDKKMDGRRDYGRHRHNRYNHDRYGDRYYDDRYRSYPRHYSDNSAQEESRRSERCREGGTSGWIEFGRPNRNVRDYCD